MNNYTEQTWTLVTISEAIKDLMKTYVKYPPRKLQSEGMRARSRFATIERFQYIRDAAREGRRQHSAADRKLR